MAVTRRLRVQNGREPQLKKSSSLQALTAAALALPGLMPLPAVATDQEFSFQHGHYQEGKRDLANSSSTLNPIEVDTLQASAHTKLADRIKFAFNYSQDTWSGATPIATAPSSRNGNALREEGNLSSGASPYIQPVTAVVDQNFNPLKLSVPGDTSSEVLGKDTQLVHTLSYASPETRKQGDFKLSYEWDNAEVSIGGGISVERDYESRFGSLGARFDFNQKLTTLNLGLSYTNSDTKAYMDHDAYDYFAFNHKFPLDNQLQSNRQTPITGTRQDWASQIGLTQILNKNALINANISYTRSTGFLENPYKGVTFIFVDTDPNLRRSDGNYNGRYATLHEQRPDARNQWTESLRYMHHIDALDAAVNIGYSFFHDDWGINAHTFDLDWRQPLGDGWTVTPKIRYYSQSAADFYQPVFLSKQGQPGTAMVDGDGNTLFDNDDNVRRYGPVNASTLPTYYTSDHRLSGYGAISGGITLSKQFTKGLNFEIGVEYYSHAGSLKLGGGGEGSFADFDYFVANAGLNVDLASLAQAHSSGGHNHHAMKHGHPMQHTPAPAGVMFDHALHRTGDLMVGYRYMYSDQAGGVLHGGKPASDAEIVRHGCKNRQCSTVPAGMTMHMHMLDLMYAPTDWLTLMLMPQFVDMDMRIRDLQGAPPSEHQHGVGGHATGGVGDTGFYAIGKLLDKPGHHVNLSLGFTAPTGDVGIYLRNTHQQGDQLIHYGMQLGSGTWDFKPSLTYTGELENWLWGAQVTGTKRLASKNASGFAFGDVLQASLWGGYNLTHWLSASLRGVYTVQGTIKNDFNAPHPGDGPNDHQGSYGGRYWDLGLGLSAVVPSGDLQGNRLSVEWLQPIHDDVNGYQVERDAALTATWSYMF